MTIIILILNEAARFMTRHKALVDKPKYSQVNFIDVLLMG